MACQFAPLSPSPWPTFTAPGVPREGVHLWQLQCSLAQSWLDPCWQWLDGPERARAARFHRDRDRQTFILGRGGMRWLLGQYLQRHPASFTFTYGDQGKPMLPLAPPDPPIAFNVAHSGDWVVYGITPGVAIGVDVETPTPRRHLGAIIQRCLTPREQATLPPLDSPQCLGRFLDYWTVKEAYLKATGLGLYYPMAQVEVAWQPQPHLTQPVGAAHQWTVATWQPQPAIAAAVCVAADGAAIALGEFPWELRSSLGTGS